MPSKCVLAGQMPQIYRDENGVTYTKTKGGNIVQVGQDPQGRVYFIDPDGNFYYDTGIPDLGFYMVRLILHVLCTVVLVWKSDARSTSRYRRGINAGMHTMAVHSCRCF